MEKNGKVQINLTGFGIVEMDALGAVKLGHEIISAIVRSDAIDELMSHPPRTTAGAVERDLLRDAMIQLLEEKFGLQIKDDLWGEKQIV
ncbi:MAG: hypothetical protein Q7R84_03355 [bacterium]|nr:hypothetical protein [bacterium]